MAVDTTKLAAYLRLPPDTTEDLSGFLAAALSKARAAGIPDFRNNAQYDIFILALAAMFYDNRGMRFAGSSARAAVEANIQSMINSFVLELRYATEDGDAT